MLVNCQQHSKVGRSNSEVGKRSVGKRVSFRDWSYWHGQRDQPAIRINQDLLIVILFANR